MSAELDRFEAKYCPEPNSGCWLWTAALLKPAGRTLAYGTFKHAGRQTGAHRVAWTLYRGEIPAETCVLHRCDTPSCVNPAHLFLGTDVDNMRDKRAKGRHRALRGEAHPMAKLSAPDVADAVRAIDRGESRASVAARLGVHIQTTYKLTGGTRWKHLDHPKRM